MLIFKNSLILQDAYGEKKRLKFAKAKKLSY